MSALFVLCLAFSLVPASALAVEDAVVGLPKTGVNASSLALAMLSIAVICGMGAVGYKKMAHKRNSQA